MKDTMDTRILATVFHKHKYITNPGVTSEDQFIAAAGQLADDLKSRMAHHLSATTLDQLGRIGTILKQFYMHRDQQQPPGNPPIPSPRHTYKVPVAIPQTGGVRLPIPCKLYNPHLIFQTPKPVSLATPASLHTATSPRVVPPLRAAQPVNPMRSPQLAAQFSER